MALTTTGQRRARVLGALLDGEYRVGPIAAWADMSEPQARAALRWLEDEGFAQRAREHGGHVWAPTAQGRAHGDENPDEGWSFLGAR